jgi:hypothetical protein
MYSPPHTSAQRNTLTSIPEAHAPCQIAETPLYEEEDTCMSYEEEDACRSYEEEDACMSYEVEDTCMAYEEEDTHTKQTKRP